MGEHPNIVDYKVVSKQVLNACLINTLISLERIYIRSIILCKQHKSFLYYSYKEGIEENHNMREHSKTVLHFGLLLLPE